MNPTVPKAHPLLKATPKHFLRHQTPIAWYEAGQGHPVICLHGNPSWSILFRPLFTGLGEGIRVISMDQLGCGQSGTPKGEYGWNLDSRMADFGAFVDHVAPGQKVSLVAHDWGGMIATSWAVRNPDRVASMVLMNTAGFPMPKEKSLPRTIGWCRAPLIGPLLTRGLNAFLRGAIRYGTHKPLAPEVAAAYLAPHDNWARRRSIQEFVNDIPLNQSHPSWQTMVETQNGLCLLKDKPILLPWGQLDFVFDDDYLNEFQLHFRNARPIAYAKAGHWLLEDEPEAITGEIRQFLHESVLGSVP